MRESIPTDMNEWNALFSAAFPSLPITLVEVTDAYIRFHSNAPDFSKKMSKILLSPEAMKANLSYALVPSASVSSREKQTITEKNYPKIPPKPKKGDGKEILKQLCSNEVITKIGFNNGFVEEHMHEVQGDELFQLYTKPTDDLQIKSVYQTFADIFRKFLATIDLYHLRRAYTKIQDLSTVSGSSEQPWLKNSEEFFGFKENEDGTGYIYFDYQYLYQLIFPPVLQQKNHKIEEKDSRSIFEMKKNHILLYLSRIFPEKFILSIMGNGEEKYAQPIFFLPNPQHINKAETLVYLILDCSGSMRETFEKYINIVKNFVDKLFTNCENKENTRIKIISFNHEVKYSDFYRISETKKIKNYLSTLQAFGGTRLYNATCCSLDELLNLSKMKKNTTAILFTDGLDESCDGKGHDPEKDKSELNNLIGSLQKEKFRPKIFTFGFGSCYDKKLLTDLISSSAGEHTELNNIEDFKAVFHYFTQINELYEFVQILFNLQDEAATVSAPIYTGKPTVIDLKIPINQTQQLTVDGTSYDILPPPKLKTNSTPPLPQNDTLMLNIFLAVAAIACYEVTNNIVIVSILVTVGVLLSMAPSTHHESQNPGTHSDPTLFQHKSISTDVHVVGEIEKLAQNLNT